jgi:hypothetical protein
LTKGKIKITRRWNEANPKEPTLIQKKVMLQKTRDTAKEKKRKQNEINEEKKRRIEQKRSLRQHRSRNNM